MEPLAVDKQIDVQLYDPAFTYQGANCQYLTNASSGNQNYTNNLSTSAVASMNDYVSTDGVARYNASSSIYCPGDYYPGCSGTSCLPANVGEAPITSYVLRAPTQPGNPLKSTPITGCTKQFAGNKTPPTFNALRQNSANNGTYNPGLASTFHSWYSLCKFTPTVAGDYYIQVRTNVSSTGGVAVANKTPSGTPLPTVVWTDNPNVGNGTVNASTSVGLNAFSMRAYPTAGDDATKKLIAVAGDRYMPILQNASGSTASFNLIRALPGARGQYIAFDFYDAADGVPDNQEGSVRVVAPTDATGGIRAQANIKDCRYAIGDDAYLPATDCTVKVKNGTNNGKVEHLFIPIPDDYDCKPDTLGGCWFTVEIKFPGTVTDFTTWDANIGGDPVRLVE